MKNWFLLFLVGVLSIGAGVLALANPFAATLTAELLAGYSFLAIGILIFISAFQDRSWGGRVWAAVLGILITVFGYNLVAHPLQGMLQLTIIIASLMIAIGVARLLIASTPLAAGARLIMVISGTLSIALAVMIFSNFPWSGAVVLGVFLAVELISNGVSLIIVALDRRKAEPV